MRTFSLERGLSAVLLRDGVAGKPTRGVLIRGLHAEEGDLEVTGRGPDFLGPWGLPRLAGHSSKSPGVSFPAAASAQDSALPLEKKPWPRSRSWGCERSAASAPVRWVGARLH